MIIVDFRGNRLDVKFLPSTSHNPYCDIMTATGKDNQMCYGIYINGTEAGKEFWERYKGPNYVPGSTEGNWSRHYKDGPPDMYKDTYDKLKQLYKEHFFNARFDDIFES